MSSARNDAEFNAITSDVLTSSKSNTTNLYNKFVAQKMSLSLCWLYSFPDSLLLDHEIRKMIESVSTTSSDHLEWLNEKHSEGTESIRNISSNCLEKDYMVSSKHFEYILLKFSQTKLYYCCLAESGKSLIATEPYLCMSMFKISIDEFNIAQGKQPFISLTLDYL